MTDMNKETTKKITVGMFDILDAQVGSIALHLHTDEEGDSYYHAVTSFNIDDGTDEGCWLTFDTTINNPCKVCAAKQAGMLVSVLAGGGLPSVLVFDENGDLVEEFSMLDLPPHLNEENVTNLDKNRILH